MSQKVVCDRCKKVIDDEEDHGKLSFEFVPGDTNAVGVAWSGMDICPTCEGRVRNLIDCLRLAKPEPVKKTRKPRTPKPKVDPLDEATKEVAPSNGPHPHFRD